MTSKTETQSENVNDFEPQNVIRVEHLNGVQLFTYEGLMSIEPENTRIEEAATQACIARNMEEVAGLAYKAASKVLKKALQPGEPPFHGWVITSAPTMKVVDPDAMPPQIRARWEELRTKVEAESKELKGIEDAYSDKVPNPKREGSLKWAGE